MTKLNAAIARFIYVSLRMRGLSKDRAQKRLEGVKELDEEGMTLFLDELSVTLANSLNRNKLN